MHRGGSAEGAAAATDALQRHVLETAEIISPFIEASGAQQCLAVQ